MSDNTGLLNVCGLWENKSSRGERYLSGRIGNLKVMIFKVENKKTERHPDYSMCFAPYERREESGGDGGETPNSPGNDDMPF